MTYRMLDDDGDVEILLVSNFPETVDLSQVFLHESRAVICDWCRDRFGESARHPEYPFDRFDVDALWGRFSHRWYFKDPTHAFEFKLTWG